MARKVAGPGAKLFIAACVCVGLVGQAFGSVPAPEASAGGGAANTVDQAPALVSFETAPGSDGLVTVYGTVEDEHPAGCYVQFGGALAGYFALVNADGTFSETFEVDVYSSGPASAQAVDGVGYDSNVLWDDIL